MSITNEGSAPNPSSEIITPHRRERSRRIELLSRLIRQDLGLMAAADVSSEAVKNGLDQLLVQIDEASTRFDELGNVNESCSADAAATADDQTHLNLERDLQLLKKKVSKMISIFPFSVVIKPVPSDSHVNRRDRSTPHLVSSAPDKLMQKLTASNEKSNRSTPTVEELDALVRGMKNRSRMCLICFLAFPENAIIKKSLLVCWAKANEIGFLGEPMDDLVTKGLIQPVYKDTFTVGGYWMQPFIRSTLTDHNWLQIWDLTRWVYVADSTTEEDMRMLHLGNWQRTSLRHIELEDPDLFFKDMDELSNSRYVSLRGISLVPEVPEFIMKIEKLEILDLKACHNLEVFPSDIGNLWCSLTHLDMSECYFLEHMPVALSKLRYLRVLKGFFVGETKEERSCTLRDLLVLEDLMKLNIYTSVISFPDDDQLATLKEFKFLHSLTISWGGCSIPRNDDMSKNSMATNTRKHQQDQEEVQPTTTSSGVLKKISTRRDSIGTTKEISFNLEKLDLQCFPEAVTPDWLNPTNFKHVKNLYIRGGQLGDLGQLGGKLTDEYQWSVEILRLKHLSHLEMDYSDILYLFPKLICFENVECPNLRHFPSDNNVWKNTTEPPPTTFH